MNLKYPEHNPGQKKLQDLDSGPQNNTGLDLDLSPQNSKDMDLNLSPQNIKDPDQDPELGSGFSSLE